MVLDLQLTLRQLPYWEVLFSVSNSGHNNVDMRQIVNGQK